MDGFEFEGIGFGDFVGQDNSAQKEEEDLNRTNDVDEVLNDILEEMNEVDIDVDDIDPADIIDL